MIIRSYFTIKNPHRRIKEDGFFIKETGGFYYAQFNHYRNRVLYPDPKDCQ